jgi:hypothetical protein
MQKYFYILFFAQSKVLFKSKEKKLRKNFFFLFYYPLNRSGRRMNKSGTYQQHERSQIESLLSPYLFGTCSVLYLPLARLRCAETKSYICHAYHVSQIFEDF